MKEDEKRKTVQMIVRVDPGFRDLFLRTCKNNDLKAAQVMRKLMKNYINNPENNGGLF